MVTRMIMENKKFRFANGFKILNFTREIESVADWDADDYIQTDSSINAVLQFCRWEYKNSKGYK